MHTAGFKFSPPGSSMDMESSAALNKPLTGRTNKKTSASGIIKFVNQVSLLLWKRYVELKKQPTEWAKLLLGPWLIFTLMILFYNSFSFLFVPGFLEVRII